MSKLSDYLENQIVSHIFRASSFAKPTVLGIALFTAPPSDSGGGIEVTGGSYSRFALDPSDVNWAAPVNGQTSNVVTITFTTATADWGVVTHAALFDSTSSGNMLTWAPLDESVQVFSGDQFVFLPGQLTFTLD